VRVAHCAPSALAALVRLANQRCALHRALEAAEAEVHVGADQAQCIDVARARRRGGEASIQGKVARPAQSHSRAESRLALRAHVALVGGL
jgi:hypothetical protein